MSSGSMKSNSSNIDDACENDENGEGEVDRLVREAIDVLREGNMDIAEASNTDTGASSPAQYSQASNGSGVDFFGELKEKIAHMRNKDEV